MKEHEVLAVLGANAAIVGFVSGFGELLGPLVIALALYFKEGYQFGFAILLISAYLLL